MKNLKLELAFLDTRKKQVVNVQVESLETDAFIHEHNGSGFVNSGFPDVNWLTYIAEKVLGKKLNGFSLDGIKHI